MEIEVSGSSNESLAMEVRQMKGKFVDEKYQIRVKSLQAVLEECQRALESLGNCEDGSDEDDDGKDAVNVNPQVEVRGVGLLRDEEADELRDLLKSRIQCSDFLEKLEFAQASVPENIIGYEPQSTSASTEQDLLP